MGVSVGELVLRAHGVVEDHLVYVVAEEKQVDVSCLDAPEVSENCLTENEDNEASRHIGHFEPHRLAKQHLARVHESKLLVMALPEVERQGDHDQSRHTKQDEDDSCLKHVCSQEQGWHSYFLLDTADTWSIFNCNPSVAVLAPA